MTTHDAIKHLSYKIAFTKQRGEKYADVINIEALEIAVRAMAEERKKGEWERHYFFHVEVPICSQCRKVSPFKNDFCPNCGADMREEKAND